MRPHARHPPRTAPIITANYGEAGAVDRFGAAFDLGEARVYSGHNELWHRGHPPDAADTAVFVGYSPRFLAPLFESCEMRGELDNGLGVDNEEQGEQITVCTGLRVPWSEAWPRFAHLD